MTPSARLVWELVHATAPVARVRLQVRLWLSKELRTTLPVPAEQCLDASCRAWRSVVWAWRRWLRHRRRRRHSWVRSPRPHPDDRPLMLPCGWE